MRVSVSAQAAVVAIVMALALLGALATVRSSDELRDRSSDVLLLRGIQNEFARARLALRDYVNTGDAFRLGPYSQAESRIRLMATSVSADAMPAERDRVRAYVTGISAYFDHVGDRAVSLARRGRLGEARGIVSGQGTVARVKRLQAQGFGLVAHFERLQREAEHAVRNRQYVNVGLIALAGALVLVAGFSVLMWIRREMMLPLDELAKAARRLGRGDLSVRVTPRGVEELALAGTAFNQMAEEIEQQVLQLQEASTARSRFVSSVSHELRTPITSLRGYLELLAGGEAGDLQPDQQHFVEIAERNARALEELINDLLTLSRIQSGRITMHPEPVDIRALLRELKAEMLPIAARKHVDIVLVDTGDLVVSGDPLRLKQAFGNLVSNAIKYSPPGQAVVLRAFRINRQVVVSVVDWGAGIPKEDLPQLAEPFFRSSATERVPGTGLGLPIAKQMIELHGGRLAVESEPGAGSTFTVYLPLRVEADGDSGEESTSERVVADASGGLDAREGAPAVDDRPAGSGANGSAAGRSGEDAAPVADQPIDRRHTARNRRRADRTSSS